MTEITSEYVRQYWAISLIGTIPITEKKKKGILK
jgi:hypothetical protein